MSGRQPARNAVLPDLPRLSAADRRMLREMERDTRRLIGGMLEDAREAKRAANADRCPCCRVYG